MSSLYRSRGFILLILVLVFVAAFSHLSFASEAAVVASPANQTLSPQALAELRRKVDPIVASTDDVELRHQSADVYRLIDALLAQGDESEATRYLRRVLQADPWSFDYQLTYGEILARHGQPVALRQRAFQAMQHAENDRTLRRAYQLAGVVVPPPPPSLGKTMDTAPELVLLQLGMVSQFWLADLRDALAVRLGIRVTVAQLPFTVGQADRTGLQQFAAAMRRRLLNNMDRDESVVKFLASQGIERQGLEKDDGVAVRAVRLMISTSGDPKDLQSFDARLREAEQSGQQWDAGKMLARIDGAVTPFKRPRRWFLAVTDSDLFAENSNYLFGIACTDGATGLISAARFAAKFNDETPLRARLTTRLLKQALSSYGFMLGVARCSNPDCARSYPHSLEEQDGKSDQLCPECRAGFERALAQKLP